jgi:hypothetical protein
MLDVMVVEHFDLDPARLWDALADLEAPVAKRAICVVFDGALDAVHYSPVLVATRFIALGAKRARTELPIRVQRGRTEREYRTPATGCHHRVHIGTYGSRLEAPPRNESRFLHPRINAGMRRSCFPSSGAE